MPKSEKLEEGATVATGTTSAGVVVEVKEGTPATPPDEERVAILEEDRQRRIQELAAGARGRDKSEFIPRGEGFPLVETPAAGAFGVVYDDTGKDEIKALEKEGKEKGTKLVDTETGKGPGDRSSYNY